MTTVTDKATEAELKKLTERKDALKKRLDAAQAKVALRFVGKLEVLDKQIKALGK